MDDADGSKFQRTSAKKFNAKWSDDGSANKDAKFDKGDMRYAIAGFRNATNEADKKAWANKIATIYTYFEQNEQNSITPDFKCARQLVKSYVD